MGGFFAPSTWAVKSTATAGAQGPGLPKCGACGLFKTCQSPKMPPSEGRRKILFVGDAPDETEDDRGTQFVGKAGTLLRGMCDEAGVDLHECSCTNAAICHPKNVVDDLHIESCRPNLLNTLERLKPNVVILLGLSAVKSLIGPEWGGDVGNIAKWAGWQIPSERYGCWLCPTYHPSYVANAGNDTTLMGIVQGHIRAAAALEHHHAAKCELDALRGAVEIVKCPRTARLRMEELARRSGEMTFDYETTGLKPERREQRIVTCSFCFEGRETWACPITPDLHPALSAVLRSPRLRKGASNLKFEERWSLAKLGHGVEGWAWDTMLAAHYHNNQPGVTSVKFQTYVHFGVGQYAEWVEEHFQPVGGKAAGGNALNNIEKAHIDDLLVYNSVDALVEWKVWQRQKELLGAEGWRL